MTFNSHNIVSGQCGHFVLINVCMYVCMKLVLYKLICTSLLQISCCCACKIVVFWLWTHRFVDRIHIEYPVCPTQICLSLSHSHFLPPDILYCKARYCDCMSSVCPSLRPSVTLVNCDHIGWNSSKIILSSVSLGCSIFATPTWLVCSKWNTPKFGPKVTHPYWFEGRRHSIANCGRMVTDSATVTMESL